MAASSAGGTPSSCSPEEILNFNVGLLGHVDSGKTSLAKALSTTASTACFDKNPQSRERGITIDLGFSSFAVGLPNHLKTNAANKSLLQYTLVDCPGHASLIKTIIGGAQIIDLMILVIDVTKGMQTQTAECLVIGEITCNDMIVVLNKCDLLPPEKRNSNIEKMKKRILKTLEKTKFADSPVVPVAANPENENSQDNLNGINKLIDVLNSKTFVPNRSPDGPSIFSVDHCFVIRGQGTVMTGTMLSGSIKINDNIEIPQIKVNKKVKSIQMFKKPVSQVMQGDRAGICVTQFDQSTLERGLVCTPGCLSTLYAVIVRCTKIHYFKGKIASKSKFHVSLGHETVMAKALFFSSNLKEFNLEDDYCYEDELIEDGTQSKVQYALLEFDHSVITTSNSLVIASKLDTDIHANLCRLAFKGTIVKELNEKNYENSILPNLKIYKVKSKEGLVERMVNTQDIICKNIFKKETDVTKFSGLKVTLSTGEEGIIEGSFGQSGKIKVSIRSGLNENTITMLPEAKKKGKGKEESVSGNEVIKVILKFKRYIFDPEKKMIQTKMNGNS